MGEETLISKLVERCLAVEASGERPVPFEEICRDHPDLQQAVEAAYKVASNIPSVGAGIFRTDSRLGTIIADRYRLDERLGAGAMGIVYGAIDLDLSRVVAVKLMRSDLLVKETTVARFEREATTLAAVRHESIVTVFDRGIIADGTPYLVMEKVDGTPCSKILEEAQHRAESTGRTEDLDDSSWLSEAFGIATLEEPSFFRQVIRWAADIASGLAAAHDVGVIHRDLKPSNIIIRSDGSAVLIDFGIAIAPNLGTLTADDEIVGTPAYMPPEALKGSSQLGTGADVYGLGATLYHLLTLQAPFQGSINEILNAVATREPVRASRIRPGIPRDAEAIMDHGMARAMTSRYSSLADMEKDLRALLAYRPVSVSSTSSWVRWGRRARRSNHFKGAVLATLLITSAWQIQRYQSKVASDGRSAYEVHWGELPSGQGIHDAGNRFVPVESIRNDLEEKLNSLAESRFGDRTEIALRALFRFDHGDLQGAASDMSSLASEHPGPVPKALAAAYRGAADLGDAPTSKELSELPKAESQAGLYLTALHFIRARRYQEVDAILDDPRLDGHRHSEELRLVSRVAKLKPLRFDKDRSGTDEIADGVIADARALAEESGFESSTISHVIGNAFARKGRYGKALEACESGLERAPFSLGMLQNGAESAMHVGDLERAESLVQRALERAPGHVILHQIRSNIAVEDGRFSDARQIIEAAPYSSTPGGARQRIGQLLIIVVAEANALGPDDKDALAALSTEAETLSSDLKVNSKAATSARMHLEALASGDTSPVFRSALSKLILEPTSLPRFKEMYGAHRLPLNEADQVLLFEWLDILGASYESLTGLQRIR